MFLHFWCISVGKQHVNGDKHIIIAEEPITRPINNDQKIPPLKSVDEIAQPTNNVDIDYRKSNSNDAAHKMDICPSDPHPISNVCSSLSL